MDRITAKAIIGIARADDANIPDTSEWVRSLLESGDELTAAEQIARACDPSAPEVRFDTKTSRSICGLVAYDGRGPQEGRWGPPLGTALACAITAADGALQTIKTLWLKMGEDERATWARSTFGTWPVVDAFLPQLLVAADKVLHDEATREDQTMGPSRAVQMFVELREGTDEEAAR
jgi:hypothetical protein